MDEDKKSRVVKLIQEASRPIGQDQPRSGSPGRVQRIVGNGNIQAGGDVHITTERVVTRPRVTVIPGDGVIDNAQAARLKALVSDWVTKNNLVRRTKLSFAAAWSALNKRAGVTAYRLIPSAKFSTLEKWLQAQIGRIGSMNSAPSKDPGWRGAKIGAIKARCKNQLGDEHAYCDYIMKNFGAASLTELSIDQLKKTYSYVMSKKTHEPTN